MTALITSKEKMEDILKIVKSLKESGLLIKGVSETINSETKEQKRWLSQNLIGYISCKYVGKYVSRKT